MALIVSFAVAVVMRFGQKGRYIFATMTFGFMALILYTVFLPILPNANDLIPVAHDFEIPDHSALTGFAMIVVVLFGAVRGFALLTGFEASVAGLSHEEDKPRWARVSMGVGTVVLVLVFTSIVTFDIANVTRILELEPTHKNTLFDLWTRSKLVPGSLVAQALTFFSIGTSCRLSEVFRRPKVGLGEVSTRGHGMHHVVGGVDSDHRGAQRSRVEHVPLHDLRVETRDRTKPGRIPYQTAHRHYPVPQGPEEPAAHIACGSRDQDHPAVGGLIGAVLLGHGIAPTSCCLINV